jgi:TRAP-type C4-dicarboxylate transport system permease small subunit
VTEPPSPDDAPPPPRSIRIEEALAAAAIGGIAVISFGNVVVRYLTNVSFAFTEEFSVFLLVVMTFVGSAFAFATDGHIRITALEDRLPRWGRLLLRCVSLVATLLVLGLVAWHGGWLAYDQWEFEETSPGLGYPQWLYTVWLPVLAILCLYRALQRFARTAGRP